MAQQSLYNTAITARKILIVILVLALAYIGWDTFAKFNEAVQIPTVSHFSFYKDPDSALGKIDIPQIKSITIDPQLTPNYALSSPFSSFPDTAYVYKIDKPREKLTTIDDAIATAHALGFGDYEAPQGDNYTWTAANGTKTLKFNKTSQVWSLKTSYTDNVDAKTSKLIYNDITRYDSLLAATVQRLGFGDSYGLTGNVALSSQFADVSQDGTLFVPDNISQARYIVGGVFRRLDVSELKPRSEWPSSLGSLTPPDTLDKVKVYNSDPRYGELRLVVSNSATNYAHDLFEFNFINYTYSFTQGNVIRSLYAVVTPDEAWTRVQSGKGALTLLTPENGNSLTTYTNLGVRNFVADGTKTELAYYEPEQWTGLVYPIFIFRGRADLEDGRQASFVIYVDAIKRST